MDLSHPTRNIVALIADANVHIRNVMKKLQNLEKNTTEYAKRIAQTEMLHALLLRIKTIFKSLPPKNSQQFDDQLRPILLAIDSGEIDSMNAIDKLKSLIDSVQF